MFFLVLGDGDAFVHHEISLVLLLGKQRQNFAWVCIIIVIIVICLLTKKKFKVNNKNVNFPTQFFQRSISKKFSASDSKEVSSKGNVLDFSVDHKS